MATFGYCGVAHSALVEFDPAPEPAESERRTAEVWVITVSRETDLPDGCVAIGMTGRNHWNE